MVIHHDWFPNFLAGFCEYLTNDIPTVGDFREMRNSLNILAGTVKSHEAPINRHQSRISIDIFRLS